MKYSAVLVFALVATLAACSGAPAQRPAAQAAKTVTIAISSDEGTLTPFTNESGYPGDNLVKLIFDTLLVQKGETVAPSLATAVETTDNKVFRLPLRTGVTWQDGRPFTAADVVFSVEFYRKNLSGDSAIDVRPIRTVKADGDAVTMTLDAADPEFPLRILSDMAVLPQHLWESVTKVNEAGTDKAIGTGPFRLTAYDKERGYTLTANPGYFGGKPKVDTVKVNVIPQETTQFAALRTGEVALSVRNVPPQQRAALQSQPNIGIAEGTEFASTMLQFNTTRPPFDRAEVRRALAKAVDVRDLVKTALLGQGTPGNPGFVHPESPVGGPALPPLFDVEAAKRELDALGAKPGPGGVRTLDGKPMSYELLVQSTSTDRLRSAELIRDMLKNVGVEIKVTSLDPDSLDTKVWPDYDVKKGRNYDLTMWGWSAPVMQTSSQIVSLFDSDPEDGNLNIGGFSDAGVDKAIDELKATTTPEKRAAAAAGLQQKIAEQLPFLTLYYRNGAYAYRKDAYAGWTWQNGLGVLHSGSFVG
ncbi:ABC transporter substrate-binding protein [Nonomuraea sp. NPDC059023]|uniref:ABC transporter substrate-binding protein n=1 Tax=unclassified Nonomuraea TaxID=2593643 RepID=UPI003685ADAE